MGMLDRIETRASKGGDFFLSNPDAFALQLMGASGETAAGIHVTEQTALEWSALAAAIRILCNTTAMVPLHVLGRTEDGKEQRRDHALYPLLHDAPNEEMTALEFRALIPCHTILWGAFYAQILRDNGTVSSIWPLNPDRVRPVREGRTLRFDVTTPDGEPRTLSRDEVLYIPGFSTDGLIGRSMAKDHREAIGLGLATEQYAARFFGNDASPGGVIKHPETLNDEVMNRLQKSWEDAHQGLTRAHRVAVLEEGMEWQQVMTDPEKADALGLRKFQVNEAIRIVTGIPPHLIGDLERATFSNVEEQSRNFVQFGLQPTATRIEQRMNLQLLTEGERDRDLFVEHQLQGLLRGSVEARTNMYQIGLNHGWLTINDVRALENLNSIGPNGDVPFIRMDMQPLERAINAPPPEPPMRTREGDLIALQSRMRRRPRQIRASRESIAASFDDLFRDAMQRITAREIVRLRAALKVLEGGDIAAFRNFLASYYFETLPPQIREIVGSLFLAYAEQIARAAGAEIGQEPDEQAARDFAEQYAEGFSNRHSAASRKQVEALLEEPGESVELINQRLADWEEGAGDSRPRAARMAHQELRQLGQGVARAVFVAGGVAFLVSRAVGDSCPYCLALDGRRVGPQQPFIREGEMFEPEGADGPLIPKSNRFTPPYHGGCDCRIEPEL